MKSFIKVMIPNNMEGWSHDDCGVSWGISSWPQLRKFLTAEGCIRWIEYSCNIIKKISWTGICSRCFFLIVYDGKSPLNHHIWGICLFLFQPPLVQVKSSIVFGFLWMSLDFWPTQKTSDHLDSSFFCWGDPYKKKTGKIPQEGNHV